MIFWNCLQDNILGQGSKYSDLLTGTGIRSVQNLESLSIVFSDKNRENSSDCKKLITAINELKKLNNLYIQGINIPNDSLNLLNCPTIQNLDISFNGNHMYDCYDFSFLSNLVSLNSVEVEGRFEFQNHSFVNYTPLNNLQYLKWEYLPSSSQDFIHWISSCKKLKHLEINAESIDSLDLLKECPFFETLKINECTLENIDEISRLTNIKNLVFSRCLPEESDDDTVIKLAKMKQLKTLELGALDRTKCTFRALEHIASMPMLENIEFRINSEQLKGLKFLNTLPKLKRVHIDAEGLDSKKFRNLCDIPFLEELYVSFDKASQEDLNYLEKKKNIRKICIGSVEHSLKNDHPWVKKNGTTVKADKYSWGYVPEICPFPTE